MKYHRLSCCFFLFLLFALIFHVCSTHHNYVIIWYKQHNSFIWFYSHALMREPIQMELWMKMYKPASDNFVIIYCRLMRHIWKSVRFPKCFNIIKQINKTVHHVPKIHYYILYIIDGKISFILKNTSYRAYLPDNMCAVL